MKETEKLRLQIEQPTTIRFWGQDVIVTPRLVERVFGDGKTLLAIAPINFRPNHFVVRIDSSLSISNRDSPCLLDDCLDDIYDAIEEEYYEWPWAEEYGFSFHEDENADCDSRINFGDGCAWWKLEWPHTYDEMKKYVDKYASDLDWMDAHEWAGDCELCGGEGVREYQDSPDEWGGDTPDLVNHLVPCKSCQEHQREMVAYLYRKLKNP